MIKSGSFEGKNIEKKHILVIRLSAMGDVAMSVGVVRTLLIQYPNVKITFLSRPFLKPLFEEIPNVVFYAVDSKDRHKGFLGIYRLYKELKNKEFDAFADLHNVMRSRVLNLFFWKLPSATIDKGRKEKKQLTRSENKIFKQLKTTHERYADVFRELGFQFDLFHSVPLPHEKLNQTLLGLIGGEVVTKKLIGIAPFAQHEAKTYPIDLMEEVIEQLEKQGNYKILLFGGGQKEISILSIFEKKYNDVICIAGKLRLKEELHLISNLGCMLSMDSGNAHLAALFGIPTITLWGATHPYAGFAPFGQSQENALLSDRKKFPKLPTSIYGNKKVEDYQDAMRTIRPTAIVERVRTVLK